MVGDTFTEVINPSINILRCGITVRTHHNAIHQIQSQANSLKNFINLSTRGSEAQWLPQVLLELFPPHTHQCQV